MKITIESTNNLVEVAGTLCRLWNGVTADGRVCQVFVKCLAVSDGAPLDEFKELIDTPPDQVVLPSRRPCPVQFSDN